MAVIADPARFIQANTRRQAVPLRPDIVLYLADEVTALWQKTETELAADGLPPPFWAFAWAGGQALAAYLGANPQLVANRGVLDFAAGSGLVAIAAAKAGAARVEASDIDAMACAAMALNATTNAVTLIPRPENLIGRDEGWDVVLAGDIAYQRDMAEAALAWLESLARRGATVLIGDPGRSYLPRERLEALAAFDVPVPHTIEDADVKRASVWRFLA